MIKVMLGVDPDGKILGARVLAHKETPGRGDKIEVKKGDWILRFTGLSIGNPPLDKWKVKKDGGQFDQFAGATITPRAAVKAIREGLQFFEHLMQRRRAFFLLMLAYVCFTALFEFFLLNNDLELVPTVFRLTGASLLAALVISDRRRLHWVLAVAVLASQLWFTYSYTFVLAASPTVHPEASGQ